MQQLKKVGKFELGKKQGGGNFFCLEIRKVAAAAVSRLRPKKIN
jgi:hypothetical protein